MSRGGQPKLAVAIIARSIQIVGGKGAVRVLERVGSIFVVGGEFGDLFPYALFLTTALAMKVIGPGQAEQAMRSAAHGRVGDRLAQLVPGHVLHRKLLAPI